VRRREFITLLGGAAAWPVAARAQQRERMRRIGVLMSLAADDKQAQARLAAFLQGLQELGWTDGHNARIDIRSSVAAAGIVTPLTMRGRVLSWPCHSLSQPNS
jgi:putative tryptophan/tyrosine transport system substrate-binding protein